VLDRVAASGAAMNGSSALHLTMFGLNPVVKFGNDRLKDTFLPRAAAGDLPIAFGVTEPDPAPTRRASAVGRSTTAPVASWCATARSGRRRRSNPRCVCCSPAPTTPTRTTRTGVSTD